MKTAIALLAVTLGAAIPLQTASANESRSKDTSLTTLSQNQDISSAKRKRHRVYVYPGYYGYRYAYPRAFSAGDPSYQSPELIRLHALNRCVFDLGYGRWQNCD